MHIVDEAIKEYNVKQVYSLFSGGHDSLTATHIASQHPNFTGVIHIDTTTGLPETQQFVKETCQAQGWPLIIQQPFLPYTALLMKYGFPGGGMHGFMYQRLKERPLRQVIRAIKKEFGGKNIGLVSGVRQQESDRRALISADNYKDGSKVWIPLIADFTASDCTNYISDHHLKRSPVKDKLHMSGECFCGCFTKTFEYQELKIWYPKKAEQIRRWRRLVREAMDLQIWEKANGFRDEIEIKPKYCEWGNSSKTAIDQPTLFPMCNFCRNGAE